MTQTNLTRNEGHRKRALSITRSNAQEAVTKDGSSGPMTRFRHDLPGSQGQPYCESTACDHATREIKPGMHYKIRDIYMFHLHCPQTTSPESRAGTLAPPKY